VLRARELLAIRLSLMAYKAGMSDAVIGNHLEGTGQPGTFKKLLLTGPIRSHEFFEAHELRMPGTYSLDVNLPADFIHPAGEDSYEGGEDSKPRGSKSARLYWLND
jgi:hypothetical protein